MGKALTDFGLQVGQDIAGSAIGLALGSINDKRQLKQQGKLQAQQIQGQKELTSYNQAAALKMWQDTNYSAQMEQLKKAGLNPAMIYGMSGSGGTTAQVTQGNVTGGHAPTGGGEAIAMGTTMAQLGLMKAQKDNIEADTANKIANIPKTGAETKSLLQGIENAKAQKELTEVQTRIEYVREHIATMTQNAAVAAILTELRKSTATMHILENDQSISTATKDTKIKIIQTELALMVLEKWKKIAETTNINQSTRESVNRVSMAIQENMRNWDKMGQVNQQLDINKGMWQNESIPQELKDVLDQIIIIPTLGGRSTNPIKGFHKR